VVGKTILNGCGNDPDSDTWACRGYGAVNCAVALCVRTYDASVVNRQFTETLVDSQGFWLNWTGYGLVDLNCISAEDRRLLATNYTLKETRWMLYRLEDIESVSWHIPRRRALTPLGASLRDSGCLYSIDELFDISLWSNFLNQYFIGTLNGSIDNNIN
jgi:hypothetical protein